MPILHIALSHSRAEQLLPAVAALLQTHVARTLHKLPEVTAIAARCIPPEHWFIGGQSLAQLQQNSISVDIKVTDGTNHKDEKARFIAECHAGLAELLMPLHPVSYVHVHEVKGDAYGYAGHTQEWRYVQGQAALPLT